MNTVYIDELFILNAVVNYALLAATRRIIRLKSSKARLLLGSIIGAAYAVFMFLPHNKLLYTMASKFIFSLLLVAVTYNIKTFRQYIKAASVFYMVSFAFGGAVYGFLSFAGKEGAFGLTFKIFVISTSAAYCCIALLSSYCKRLYLKERHISAATVSVGGKTQKINCFMDTGNSLYDPISGSPVMVVQYKSLLPVIPPCILAYLEEGGICKFPDAANAKIKFIPYNCIGEKNGVIVGFKPDSVCFGEKTVHDIVIGLCENSLSVDSSYEALTNPYVLEGGS
ncbi:MAG: sigma-E processing peptidase SpoIIGA [Firmicutes bacterium]|nr:sigma-E processing peptidase SpoIIGA [Bacillota bacterium]